MKKKILILFLLVLTIFVFCFGMGNTVAAMAQETPETEQSGELIPEEETPVTGENTPSYVGQIYSFEDEGGSYEITLINETECLIHAVSADGSGMLDVTGEYEVVNEVLSVFALNEHIGDFQIQGNNLILIENTPSTDDTTEPPTEDEEEENDLAIAFMQYLKDEYGEDYETYYNAIIEKWGSVKNYLDSKIQDGTITDESAEWWNVVVKWLDEYFVVWAPILAGAAVIVALVFGKKIYAGIKKLFNRLFKGTNQTAVAQIAIIDAVLLMLGTGEKTKAARDELLNAKEELLKNE